MTLYEYDQQIRTEGFPIVCGVDEAGRGPLAGPVYAAAVILPPGLELEGLNDSKKISEKKRNVLFEEITANCQYAIAWADHEEIDSLNILEATFLAMRRAVEGLGVRPDCALIDGNGDPSLAEVETRLVVKGDGVSAAIAAASILAKVARDRYLYQLDEQYPLYQFAKHKGYPTKLHYELLDTYGPSPVHRTTFLRRWMARPR